MQENIYEENWPYHGLKCKNLISVGREQCVTTPCPPPHNEMSEMSEFYKERNLKFEQCDEVGGLKNFLGRGAKIGCFLR